MTDPAEHFKVNLNQNLWGLVISLVTLGTAEFHGLRTLFWFGVTVSSITLISVTVTTFAYTVNYWKHKWDK